MAVDPKFVRDWHVDIDGPLREDVDIGAAAENRMVVALSMTVALSPIAENDKMEVGGVELDRLQGDEGEIFGFYGVIPTGTTADFELTLSEPVAPLHFLIYVVHGADPEASFQDILSSVDSSPAVQVDLPPGGATLNVSGIGVHNEPFTVSWTGGDEDTESNIDIGGVYLNVSSSHTISPSGAMGHLIGVEPDTALSFAVSSGLVVFDLAPAEGGGGPSGGIAAHMMHYRRLRA